MAVTLRWNGTAWTSVPLPQPAQVMLFGVKAVAADDVWAVGHLYPGGPHWIPAIFHWDGSAWSRAVIPAFPNGGQLRDIVALSSSNVYAVGLDGEGLGARSLVLRWDGSTWTRENTPGPETLRCRSCGAVDRLGRRLRLQPKRSRQPHRHHQNH